MAMRAQQEKTSVRYYVSDDNQITINCPSCGAVTETDVSKFKDIKREIKVKCKCKKIFSCSLEFRKHYRKMVKLAGEYLNLSSKERDIMVVTDISLGGVSFRTIEQHTINKGELLNLTFKLNDKKKTEIKIQAKAMSVSDYNVGAKFHGPHPYKKDLTFYFMS
jgi:hypothetical protein